MARYPNLDELDKLWPEEGYAVIVEDEFKPPDSEDFVNVEGTYNSPDFELPDSQSSYSYWVHDADGNRYNRSEWRIFRANHRLTDAVQTVLSEEPVDELLQELKDKGQRWWERDDVIWFEIVLSLSTLRGSYGSQIVVDEDGEIDEHKYGSVAFETLEQIDPDHRYPYLEARLYGNVAMHPTKAEALERNFEQIKKKYGNPRRAKVAFEEADGATAKLDFLKQFNWIGNKYARNILMDLYLDESQDFIAIDTRIEGILKEAGYPFEKQTYEGHEEFLQSVASNINLEPWELDRTLYNFEDKIQAAL